MKVNDDNKAREASPASRFLKATEDLVFHHVHGGQLIYNTSWEDPRIDRELLKLDASSRVVMITSAGQGEGKTTLSCLLALSLAQTGKRTWRVPDTVACSAWVSTTRGS